MSEQLTPEMIAAGEAVFRHYCFRHVNGAIPVYEAMQSALATPAAAAEPSDEPCARCGAMGKWAVGHSDFRCPICDGHTPALATPAAAAEPRNLSREEHTVIREAIWDSVEVVHPGKVAAAEPSGLTKALQAIVLERSRQDQQWGGPGHDDEHDAADWREFIKKQAGRISYLRLANPRDCFIKIAALAVAAIESIDRRALRTGDKP
jgi:hypothetical protein